MKRTDGKNVLLTMAIMISMVAALAAPRLSHAGTDADLRAGLYTDMSGVTVGAGLLAGMGSSWFFNPNLEAAMGDHGNLVTLNADFHYDFASAGAASIYIGAGPGLLIASPDGGDTTTDLGLNVLGGVAASRGGVRPFGQVKGIIAEDTEFALMGGIRF